VNDAELGGVVRALRHRRGWRQADLAGKAGVSASLIGLLERGHPDALSVRAIRRIASAVELRLGWDAGYRGPELARLRDADHARLAEWLTQRLERFEWTVVPEASFNHYGDRGRIDLLAFHPPTGTLVVIEVKTVIAEIQDLLGALNTKERVAPAVARSLGWRAARGAVPGRVGNDHQPSTPSQSLPPFRPPFGTRQGRHCVDPATRPSPDWPSLARQVARSQPCWR
jgi:transcriptional regulator with XRE-family HTH domain